MKLDLDGLEAFVQIAAGRSFGRAATVLNVSQPALSRRMKRLEETTGVRLLDRTTQRVELTAVGKAFLPRAERLVMELQSAADSLADMTHRRVGTVSVACIPTVANHFLPSAILEYSREHPDVRVRVLDLSSAEVLRAVLDGAAEFGIGFVERLHPELEFEPLLSDPFVLVCRADHPLAAHRRVPWQSLAAHRIVRVGPRSGTAMLLDFALARLGLQLQWFHEVEYHFSSAIGLCRTGLVVTVLPRLAIPEGAHPELVVRPLGDPPLERELGLVRRRQSTQSPSAAALIEVLRRSRPARRSVGSAPTTTATATATAGRAAPRRPARAPASRR